jgi:predicted dehydrogenase
MEKIKVGIIGMGLIGTFHADALKRVGIVDLDAVSDSNFEMAKNKASQFGVKKCYENYQDLINDPEIQVIHDCTPNHLHLSINEQIIRAGKHILSEKPLARSAVESAQMLETLKKFPNTVAGVNFNYRMNPLVQDMRSKVVSGEIGDVRLVHGSYLQDWLLYDTDYNWRIEPEYGGISRCVADIGVHWVDTAQTVLGSRISEVCADVVTIVPIRKKPVSQAAAFAVSDSNEYEEKKISSEDYAGAFVRFENGATGIFYCSQISAGRKCFLNIEVDGSEASLYWNQENADWMWYGNRDSSNLQVMRNPSLLSPEAAKYTMLPAGHPEGWFDALKNNFLAFYSFIHEGKNPTKDRCDFATFEDGHYIMRITEAIMKSGREKRWVSVDEI